MIQGNKFTYFSFKSYIFKSGLEASEYYESSKLTIKLVDSSASIMWDRPSLLKGRSLGTFKNLTNLRIKVKWLHTKTDKIFDV